MTEVCKYCGRQMSFEKELNNNPHTVHIYNCKNMFCYEQPKLKIYICDSCKHSWKEWEL